MFVFLFNNALYDTNNRPVEFDRNQMIKIGNPYLKQP